MDKDTRNIIIFVGIAIISVEAAEWFFVNVLLGSFNFLIEILEWASTTSQMTPLVIIISLLILLLRQQIGDYIQSRLGL